MYCPSCGKTVNGGLRFCNSCGERIGRDDDGGTPSEMLNTILRTLFLIVFVGLGILVGLVAVLLEHDARISDVAGLALVYLLVLFGICFTLIRQIPKLIDAKLSAWKKGLDLVPAQQLAAPTTGQLEEYREPVMSVTDHTTKTLDKIPLTNR